MSAAPRTALLVVDMQRDFVSPDGSLFVAGAPAIVPIIGALVDRARDAGDLVVWSQDWHPRETKHFSDYGGVWPVHCVGGTPGAEIVDGLRERVSIDDPVIRKGVDGEDGYSAFSVRDPQSGAARPTALDAALRERRIGRLVVCGVATDWCVRESVLDARRLGYTVEVETAAIAAVDLEPGAGDAAIGAMISAGATLR
jgi:nicotinamidase/pyrazinamidase